MPATLPPSLPDARHQVRRLLHDSDPADAPTSYYALHHDAARSALFVAEDDAGRAGAFVGRFQTGIDLFRPLVTLLDRDAQRDGDTAAERIAGLLAQALMPGRPYILFAREDQVPLVGGSLHIDNQREMHILRLDARRFRPIVNVLVQCEDAPGGLCRCKIGQGDQQAVAGLNWLGPVFAEIYVHTTASARQRGWGQSVAAALTQQVLDLGRTPLYLVEPENLPSWRLAEKLGYVDTGARQVFADVVYQGNPNL